MPEKDLPLTGNPNDPEQRGNLIGLGGQYTVHDLGNGRVIKIPNSMDGSRKFVGGYGPHVLKMKRHIPLEETAAHRGSCVPHVLRLADRYPALSDLLAHPKAEPGLAFSQDKVRVYWDLIPEASPDEVRACIDGYADVCQRLWRYGIHDYVFFFLVNMGVDDCGNHVMMDFGEVAFNTTRVAKMVSKAAWETKDVLLNRLPPEYHGYYFQAMIDRLSGDNFEQHWAKDLGALDREIIDGLLSERIDDISSLTNRILGRANREKGWAVNRVSPETLALLQTRSWKGSAVELENALYEAAECCTGKVVQLVDLPQWIHEENEFKKDLH